MKWPGKSLASYGIQDIFDPVAYELDPEFRNYTYDGDRQALINYFTPIYRSLAAELVRLGEEARGSETS